MGTDFEDHFDEELDIIENDMFGSEITDKLEILRRRAYYCATTERNDKFHPEFCPSMEELEWVVSELNQSMDRRRSGRLISILKYNAYDWVLPSLARFLDGPSLSLAQKALQILRNWDGIGEYAEQVLRIMRGVSWDESGWCRCLAMSCVDEYLVSHSNPMLLRGLLDIYEAKEYSITVREDAMSSLMSIVGTDDLPREVVLTMLKERLASEER